MTTLIGPNTVVAIHYKLTGEDKQVIDASDQEPLTYLHGHGNIIKGLEEALVGLSAGTKKSVVVEPKDGYGVYEAEMVMEVPKTQFPKGAKFNEGELFELVNQENEAIMARIIAVSDQTVTLDANHPLAGKKLFFDVEIASVRAATKEELEHGHAHGPGGHHHH